MKTFLDKVIEGKITDPTNSLVNEIENWKKNPKGSLHECLGFSRSELSLVLRDKSLVHVILNSRRANAKTKTI